MTTTTGIVFNTTVEIDTDWTAEISAHTDGRVCVEMESGEMSADAAAQLALALSAAVYAAQNA